MKSYHICLLALIIVLAAGYKNTTDFWLKKLNQTTLHFQSYAGIFLLMQDIVKLIGIIPREKVECFIIYLELWGMML